MKSIFILTLFLYFVSAQEFLTFHSNGSVARFAEWRPGSAGRIRFQFRTRFNNKSLFEISSQNVSWLVRIESSFVVREYQLINQSDRILTEERFIQNDFILEDDWIIFIVRLTNQTLSFQISDNIVSFPLIQHSYLFNWLLGSVQDNFIGCIKNVRLANQGSGFQPTAPTNFSGISIGNVCVTKCNSHSCENGRCLENYQSAVCDCTGTMFSGDKCEIEISSTRSLKYSFVNQSDSLIELAPWEYNLGGRLRLQFATIHTSIPILTLSANQMLLSCRINNDGQVTAEVRNLSNLIGQLILSDSHVIGNDWSILYLTFVSGGFMIQVLSGGVTQSAVLSVDWSAGELVPLLGVTADGSDHFIGCMKGFKVSNGSNLLNAPVVRTQGVIIGPRCVDRCQNVSCGDGACVNAWSGHICDCSNTLKSGAYCSEDSNQIGLFGNESADFYLEQNPRLNHLSIMFRSLTEEGRILLVRSSQTYHSSRLLTAVLTLESADLQLNFSRHVLKVSVNIAGNVNSINISPLLWSAYSSEYWNFVAIKFNRNSLEFKVNGMQTILTTASWDWHSDRIDVGSGMIGCFSQLIVNRFQKLSERSAVSRSCPSHTSLSVYIPFSQNGLQGLSINNVWIQSRLLILQLEFLLANQLTNGLAFLDLPLLDLQLTVSVIKQTVTMTSSNNQLMSEIIVRDFAWHKLEIVLRSAGNRTLIRLAVDSHSESQVYATKEFKNSEHLIGQLRVGDDNSNSIGGCIRNVVLFGHELSIATLLSGRESEYSLNFCPVTTPCDFTPCANGATCESQNDTFLRCYCVTRFSGDFCTNSTTTQLPLFTPILTFLLPLLVSMFLLIFASAVLLACTALRRCDRGRGSYLTREETGITLMQDPQQPDTPIGMFLPPLKPSQEWPV